MRTLFILLFSISVFSLFAQETSDPKARAILEQLKKNMDGYSSLQADFTLTLEFPEESPEVQKGKVTVKGEQYRLEMEDQAVLCDGTSLWLHLKNRNEVQINNYDPEADDGDMLSPKELFRIYEKEDFIYALTNESVEDGKSVQQIEFKPTDPNSEYSKLRLTLVKADISIKRMKFFGKDGSRYTVEMDKFSPNIKLADGFFQFDASIFPNILVEDLRL